MYGVIYLRLLQSYMVFLVGEYERYKTIFEFLQCDFKLSKKKSC